MKPLRLVLPVVLMSLSTGTFAQSGAQKALALVPSDAQKSFDQMKTLAGEWQGRVTVPEVPEMAGGTVMDVSLRVTSRGHTLVHEMQEAGTPLDPTKYDHPVTMFYVDSDADRLTLVHYCDAGNRPRMTGKISPDGKTLEFDFADLSGSNKYGHMYHSVFTIIDANHHTEDWTYMLPGDKPVHAHIDLQRAK